MTRTRITALALYAGTAALLAISALLIWSSLARWGAVNDLKRAISEQLDGDRGRAIKSARAAAEALPGELAAVLPSIDLGKPGDAARLQPLLRDAGPQRDGILAALALGAILDGKAPEELPGGSDGRLLAAIGPKGQLDLPELDKDSPPGRAVLVVAYHRMLKASWGGEGSPEVARQCLSGLRLLLPGHPQANDLAVLAAGLDPASSPELLQRSAERHPDRRRGLDLMLLAARLQPRNAQAIQEMALRLDPKLKPPSPGQVLTALVERAEQAKAADETVVAACVQAGRGDLLRRLLPLVPELRRPEALAQALAIDGTVEEIAVNARPELQFKASRIASRPGGLSFHISNQVGGLPRGGLEISVDGVPIPATRIVRLGSLVAVSCDAKGQVPIQVKAAGRVLLSASVTL